MKTTCFGLFRFVVVTAVISAGHCAFGTSLIMELDYGGAGAVPGPYSPASGGYTIVDEYGQRVNGLVQNDVPSNDFGGTDWYNFHYGNNGEGFTPNVVIATPGNSYHYYPAYGNVINVAYPNNGVGPDGLYWAFTADPGYEVRLHSADLVRFNTTAFDAVANVYSGNDVNSLGPLLYSSGAVSVANTGVTFAPNVAAGSLTLQFALPDGAGPNFNWAVDNIVFSQRLVPEPSSIAMLASGLAVVAWGRRRLGTRSNRN